MKVDNDGMINRYGSSIRSRAVVSCVRPSDYIFVISISYSVGFGFHFPPSEVVTIQTLHLLRHMNERLIHNLFNEIFENKLNRLLIHVFDVQERTIDTYNHHHIKLFHNQITFLRENAV